MSGKSQKGVRGFLPENTEGSVSLGTEAWNVADGYTKIKILRLLIKLDQYETIAKFGTEELDEEMILNKNQLAQRRVNGLDRMIFILDQLIGNVKFALKVGSKDIIIGFEERIINVKEVSSGVFRSSENMINHEVDISINNKLFNLCFEILKSIKDDLNFPINQAG
ncbi:unnamed protein product, partial [marine sediment metagenome]